MNHQTKFPFSQKSRRWIETSQWRPQAHCRLFCLPYAGGSALIFRDWHRSLPEFVEVLPLQLPGKGRRFQEPPLRSIGEIAGLLAEDLLPLFREKPFAFFGHSMGAIIGYELARRLRGQHGLRPLTLMASGRMAPHVLDREPPMFNLPHDEFIAKLRRLNGTPHEVLECAELMEVMAPLLRADLEAIETYVYQPGLRLDCPILAFGGDHDPDVSQSDIEAWGHHTSAEFRMKMFAGDHFFLHPQQEELLKDLTGELLRYGPPPVMHDAQQGSRL